MTTHGVAALHTRLPWQYAPVELTWQRLPSDEDDWRQTMTAVRWRAENSSSSVAVQSSCSFDVSFQLPLLLLQLLWWNKSTSSALNASETVRPNLVKLDNSSFGTVPDYYGTDIVGKYPGFTTSKGTTKYGCKIFWTCVSHLWELERFQTAKVTFKVIQGHWQWGHSIGHIRFPISVLLQPCDHVSTFHRWRDIKNCLSKFKEVTWHITHPFWGNMMRALVSLLLCIDQHTKSEVSSFTNSKDIIGAKLKKRVTWPWPRPRLRSSLSLKAQPVCSWLCGLLFFARGPLEVRAPVR